jgi:hypothetical protein
MALASQLELLELGAAAASSLSALGVSAATPPG